MPQPWSAARITRCWAAETAPERWPKPHLGDRLLAQAYVSLTRLFMLRDKLYIDK